MAHILVAEDDKSMLNFLIVALERAGHTVVSRTNGADALDILKEAGAKTPFDLLLTDIVMPGMDGLELAQQASDLYPGIRVMFITGFAAMMMKPRGKDNAEEPHVLSKPFHLNDLVRHVDAVLAS